MKSCFVIMGFGKKKDYKANAEIDLDIIYEKVIKKEFEENFPNYKIIRADEISGSDIIDVEMYRLLLQADLVIADITTSNENALYELGVRHGIRPYSTIIMRQKREENLPFDLSHNRVLMYEDYGLTLDDGEAMSIRQQLKEFVLESESHRKDSPLYVYIPELKNPIINAPIDFDEIAKAQSQENTIANMLSKAMNLKDDGEFKEAAVVLDKLHSQIPQNEYVIQQLALATYKSSSPYSVNDLMKAKQIIDWLKPEESLNTETVGIAGAIQKQLYLKTNEEVFLESAIRLYRRGFVLNDDFYTGENYANCLLLKLIDSHLTIDDSLFYKKCAEKVYLQIIDIVNGIEEKDQWCYASLAVAHYFFNNNDEHNKYEKLFYEKAKNWEKETYNATISLMDKFKNKKLKS